MSARERTVFGCARFGPRSAKPARAKDGQTTCTRCAAMAEAALPTATAFGPGRPAESSRVSANSLVSARAVVPILLDIVEARRIVDFGCKHGEWLSVFREYGATRILGFDQQKRITEGLLVSHDEFFVTDLRDPPVLNERFDLAVCIEVAEHLPKTAAVPLVDALTAAAPVVLFSAALPNQGGHGHQNEQPRRYWTEKFARRGFMAVDCLRPRIWQNVDVAWWYRQNIFLFCADEALRHWPNLAWEAGQRTADDLELIHVDLLNRRRFARARSLGRKLTEWVRRGAGLLVS